MDNKEDDVKIITIINPLSELNFKQLSYQEYDPLIFQQQLQDIKISPINSEDNIQKGRQQQIDENSRKYIQPFQIEDQYEQENNYEPEPLYKYALTNIKYNNLSGSKLDNYIDEFEYFKNIQDDIRHPEASKSGGKQCVNQKIIDSLRSIGKSIIIQIGKQIMSGEFNLTTITFPIRCMIPKSALEKLLFSTCLFPIYINKACTTNDPFERLKLVICATIGQFYLNLSFFKPLNPIIGETCEASYSDGTLLYSEQISHHPPISYFLVKGPNNSYIYSGNYNYDSTASFNSITLKNTGKRIMRFKDGQQIEYNFGKEVYSNILMGSTKVETIGSIIFYDIKNQLEAEIKFNDQFTKPSDYFTGKIKQNKQQICKIYGTYMGYCELDGIRYWDYRYVTPFQPNFHPSVLASDSQYRKDKILLQQGQLKFAQQAKEELELIQRQDMQSRKQYQKNKEKMN